MAELRVLAILFLALHSAVSADLTEFSPSPAPEVGADSNAPISHPPAESPASSPEIGSSQAPSPWTTAFGSASPSQSPESLPPSPSPLVSLPAPADSDDYSTPPSPSPAPEAYLRAADSISGYAPEKESSGGMSGGKKAGIVFGVFIGAGVVVLAGIVYKKRQENIRRSQYGYATRRGLI